jgi:ribosome-binding protein aMBF1 (putative translation factor)
MKNLNLARAILESGLSQRKLAKKVNIHETIISMAVNGKYCFDASQEEAIADALGVKKKLIFPQNVWIFNEDNR